MVYYEDDEEPVDENTPIEDDEYDIDVDEIEGVDEDDEDDIEPIYGDEEERKTSLKWKKIESDEDDESEEEPENKEEKSETEEDKKEKKEEKVEESLDKKEPEIKLDDEEDDLEECGSSKDDDLIESIAKGFVKNNFTEAKDISGMSDEEKRQELARKSLASLNESDEEVVEIDDKELTEALGMPTEDQVKKEESKTDQETKEEKVEEKKGE